MFKGDSSADTFAGGLRQFFRHGGVAVLMAAAFVLAVTGLWRWQLQNAEHTQSYEQAATHSAESPPQQVQPQCAYIASTRTTTCVVASPSAEAEDNYAAADLKAQQEMSDWALAMFFATGVGALITFAGVVYVAMTLHETRKMGEEAAKASKAATDANTKFAEASVRDQRAYVIAREAAIRQQTGGMWLDFAIENGGKTPAYNCVLRCTWVGTFPNDELPRNFPFCDCIEVEAAPFVMGPGMFRTIKSFFVPANARFDRPIYIWGCIEYDDAFLETPRRRTEFCHRVSSYEVQQGTGSAWHHEARAHSDYNGADEFCRYQPHTPKGKRTVTAEE